MDKPYDPETDYAAVYDKSTIAISCVRLLPCLDEAGQEKLANLDG
jgi:hypothetical protein